ncbi:hypothetical protein [Chishuiella changwenlii]|jgi:hypothetical protein|uniref:hypothetical protein n=1 Tax=Chishuiella changwenlii TaxID=1434701 RepID=UPI002FDB2822
MKSIINIFLVVFGVFTIVSCATDDSLPISQDQLLRANKWQLKEIRIVKNNVTTTDKLLACERNSTLDFTDIENFLRVDYKTSNGNCTETSSNGTYIFTTSGVNRRRIRMITSTKDTLNYYMNQLDPYFMVLQDTLNKTPIDSLRLELRVYEAVK